MTLHEIYAALLRRGMPKCPFLAPPTDSDPHWAVFDGAFPEYENSVTSDVIVADLLTMHALRWRNTFPLSHDCRSVVYCLGDAMGSLNEVLNSTKHLEPK